MPFWRFGNAMILTGEIEAILFEPDKVTICTKSGRWFSCPKEIADEFLKALVAELKSQRERHGFAEAEQAGQRPPAPG